MAGKHLSLEDHDVRLVPILCTFGFALFFFPTSPTRADGMFFGEKAFKTPPAIPMQRALIAYKSGVETLIVESAFESPGQSAGWVLPLPAPPTKMDKADPWLLQMMSFRIQPEIIHRVERREKNVTFLTLTVFFWTLIIWACRPKSRISIIIALIPLLIFIFFFPIADLLNTGSGITLGQGLEINRNQEIKILNRTTIGNYDVTVLNAATPQALNTWLEANGFTTLTEPGERIVADYIQGKWCFVTAKLLHNASGLSTPHPLHLTFPAPAPVYPMRLTALAGTPVYLELFVISDQSACADPLEIEVCDVYKKKNRYYYQGRSFNLTMDALSGIENQDSFWLTKLSGTLKPKAMKNDIAIQWQNKNPFQATFYSRQGAIDTGRFWSLFIWAFGIPLVLILQYTEKNWSKNIHLFFILRVFLPVTLAAIMLWSIIYLALPKVSIITYADFMRQMGLGLH